MSSTLGRLWLFDMRVTHDGYLHTYSFTKDGMKITLSPLAPHQLPKHKPPKSSEPIEKLLTLVESNLKVSHHEFRPFRDWVLHVSSNLDETSSIPP